jgi:acyl carrier protein
MMNEAVSFDDFATVVGSVFMVSPDLVRRETTAEDVDGWDSISHTMLIARLEQEYGIRFAEDEMFDFETVGALYDRVVALKVADGS